jgi:hypothetical protein
MTFRALSPVVLGVVGVLLAACGGKTIVGTGFSPDAGDHGGGDGEDSGVTGTCVEIQLTSADTACVADSDCTQAPSGQICAGECGCGGTPVNQAASQRIFEEGQSVGALGCPCPSFGQPTCQAGQCVIADAGLVSVPDSGIIIDPPPADGGFDFDSGVMIVDAGRVDGETIDSDGGVCVDVDLATYDQSCMIAADCTTIVTGEVCSGECECAGSPVNVSGQARYDNAVRDIVFAECACPFQGNTGCVHNKCVLCPMGPNLPPGCPGGA